MLTIGCVGQPNVGKSSLMNAIMGKKVSYVNAKINLNTPLVLLFDYYYYIKIVLFFSFVKFLGRQYY